MLINDKLGFAKFVWRKYIRTVDSYDDDDDDDGNDNVDNDDDDDNNDDDDDVGFVANCCDF